MEKLTEIITLSHKYDVILTFQLGTIVNRALPSLHGMSFKITLTVPLRIAKLG